MEATAYVALGSNLGPRERSILRAVQRLESSGAVRVRKVSSLYESAAVGMHGAPPFVNAVVEVVALLRPRDLLERMQAIEIECGRVSGHNQSREIDLDLVVYGDHVTTTEELELPHPRYRERAFVLIPLREIAPAFRDPASGRSIEDLVAALVEPHSVRRVSGRGWVVRA